jgi:hypothetical protein
VPKKVKIASLLVGAVPIFNQSVARIQLKTTTVGDKTARHWIFVKDFSYSMYWAATQLKRDVNAFIATLPPTDLVSIIVFSGHGESRLVAEAIPCTPTGVNTLAEKIGRLRTMSTTVFSEALLLAKSAARKVTAGNVAHEVVLFTDGQPVPTLWNERAEIDRSLISAEQLGDESVTLSTVGYGNYYNDKFLNDLVTNNGSSGVFRHIDQIENFAAVAGEIRRASATATPFEASLSIMTPAGPSGIVLRTTPQVSTVGFNGRVKFRTVYNNEVVLFAAIPANATELTFSGTINGETFSETVQAKAMDQAALNEAMLAASVHSFQSGDLRTAAQLLNQTGDAALASRVESAYTDQERFNYGDQLRRLFVDLGVRQRYSTKKFIGKGEAACVANVLRLLVKQDCKVYIPKGAYEKTTVSRPEKDMRYTSHSQMEVYELGSNEERFNFTMNTVVDVEVNKDGAWVPDKRYRKFVIIKDGNLHVKTLEAFLTQEAFQQLAKWGVVDQGIFSEKKLYTLDLTGLPMIINSWANPVQLGLGDLMIEELVLEPRFTALNKRVKELRSEKPVYPPREKPDELDFYPAPAVTYELKGFKAPAVGDFSEITKLEEAEEQLKKTRKRLSEVRFLKRLIIFAMERTGSKIFANVAATPVKASIGKKDKMEQTVSASTIGFDANLKLRRVSWIEKVAISAKSEEAEMAVAA